MTDRNARTNSESALPRTFFQRARRTAGALAAAIVIVLVCSYGATVLQYTAQYEPGSRLSLHARGALHALNLPKGNPYRWPESLREIDYDQLTPDEQEEKDAEFNELMWSKESLKRLSAWREARAGGTRGSGYTAFVQTDTQELRIDLGATLSAANTMLTNAVKQPDYMYGHTLSHPPQGGFSSLFDKDGLLEDGCVLLDYSTIENAVWSVSFMAPFYFTVLTGVGIVWYPVYHILSTGLIVLVCVVCRKMLRREKNPNRSSFSRTLALSALISIPLPALFEVIWKTVWAYNLKQTSRPNSFEQMGVVFDTAALFGVWLGIMLLHAMVVLSVRRASKLEKPAPDTPLTARVRTWLGFRWWQLGMMVLAFIFFWTPMLMGWWNRLANEGVM